MAFAAALLFVLSSCDLFDPNKGTESIWSFEWKGNSNSSAYVDITIDNGGSPHTFRLNYWNSYVIVSWEDEGNDYFGGFHGTISYPSGGSVPYHRKYQALKSVVYYDSNIK